MFLEPPCGTFSIDRNPKLRSKLRPEGFEPCEFGDFEEHSEGGVCPGLTVRSGEHLVFTQSGTYRVGAIMRKPLDRGWPSDLVKAIRGSPKEPSPGSGASRILAFVKCIDPTELKTGAEFAPHAAQLP